MKSKSILILFVGLIATASIFAQDKSPALFTIGNEPVSVKEFKYIYEKNNSGEKKLYSEKSLRDYLDLYINFKLKVKAAKAAGMDTSAKFTKEFKNYRSQLAAPYLTDKQVTQKLIDEAYERLKIEVRVSHILITVSPDASPKDTLAAYNKAMEARAKLLKNEDFAKVAKEYSKDPSAQYNNGDLGYFTAFQMIYPFESAAYNLKKNGDITMPIRTRFGYHIIKLTDKRPYRGEVKVRHILINNNDKYTTVEQQNAKNKIDTVYALLKKGESFETLAKKYSDHQQSKDNGGELQWFNSFASYPEEFKDAAFSLKNKGDYSKPLKTTFGWHIVQLIDTKGLQTKKEMEEYIKQKISRDSRSEASREAAIERFKKEDKFKEEKKNLDGFTKMTDTMLLHGKWKMNASADMSKTLFKLNDKAYTQKDFAVWLEKNQAAKRFSSLDYAVHQYFRDYVNHTVISYEDDMLEKKYDDFKNVVNEYREGILLFEITDKLVWSKAMQDSAGLEKFFDAHKDKYVWKDRAEAQIFDLKDEAAVKEAKKMLAAKGKTATEVNSELNKINPLNSNLKEGTFEKGEVPQLDLAKWQVGMQDIGKQGDRYYLINIVSLKPAGTKKLSEVRGLAISDYQDYLEKEWLKELRGKYEVKISDSELNKLIQK